MQAERIKFGVILLFEALLYPILLLVHWWRVYHPNVKLKYRKPIMDKKVKVCVHEWGWYASVRQKKIKNGSSFQCGLKGQLDRFCNNPNVDLYLTISDFNYLSIAELKSNLCIHEVSNVGMDFSGYNSFFQTYKDAPNSYVILSNTSINLNSPSDFLDAYVDYMDNNPDVGALGISYCTKMIQTLVRPNFTPHIQSFFLMTTLDVLKEVVALNNGRFPGADINYKLLLIRSGEIRLSKLILKAGYKLAVVNPLDGVPFKFTDYKHWTWLKGDIRQQLGAPNYITPIKKILSSKKKTITIK